jgi:hypothetical protein
LFPKIELLAAVAVAGWFFSRKNGLRAAVWQARHLGRALFQRAKVTPELSKARLGYCRECPLFYEPLSTCGSPLVQAQSQVGCWCHMPTKASGLENCWNYDLNGRSPMFQFIGWGWPEELNSWPVEKA